MGITIKHQDRELTLEDALKSLQDGLDQREFGRLRMLADNVLYEVSRVPYSGRLDAFRDAPRLRIPRLGLPESLMDRLVLINGYLRVK